ncbi:T9SS type A sorting domain-containing protein [Pontibacter vulgaris]|uniref:T9SS type A sorting domain-containing protein n=1 Tax=Pontibacter vulgaris TaxID=2905679 RepID=UPI001FA77C1E|nr:T9SS type A sorting domain-containing protein [Pontibacter vulgaris]
MKRIIFLLTILASFCAGAKAQDSASGCTQEVGCFRFQMIGAEVTNTNNIMLTYTLQVNCNTRLEYVAFELPEGKTAASPADIYARDPKYIVTNGRTGNSSKLNTAFNAIQFEAKNKIELKAGAVDTFRYYLALEDYAALQTVRVQAKEANNTNASTATFNMAECGLPTTIPAPLCIIDQGEIVYGFAGATTNTDGTTTLRFGIQNKTAANVTAVTFEIPEAPQPVSVPGNGNIYKARYNYKVTLDEESGLLTYDAQNATNFSNGNGDVFTFSIPTELYNRNSYFQISVTTSDNLYNTGFNTITCDDQPIVPLPVELVSFKGKVTESGIELNWSTASEKDNDRFEIEKSSNGKNFNTIGQVNGAGNSTTAKRYNFTDTKADAGTNYYRLKQIDTNGTSEYSKIIAVDNKATLAEDGNLMLYPNPATGNIVTVALGNANTTGTILRIMDRNGREVHRETIVAGTRQTDLLLQSLHIKKGMYMISIQQGDKIESKKLIVQ